MAESTASTSQTEASPLTGPSSFADSQGLPAIKEASPHRISHDFNAADHRLVSMSRPSGGSRNASIGSSMAHSYNEKSLEELHPRHRYTAPANAAREAWQRSEPAPISGDINQDFDTRGKPKLIMKEKRGGLRNTIRRMFGRRPPKERISMPNPSVYPRHNPEEFITSATGVDVKKERSASVPNPGFLRTSGLASHPPSQPQPKFVKADQPPIPTPIPPERRVPERPPRPRRASVPSILLNREEVQAVSDAVAGLAIVDSNDHTVDARNIGFAVTNGSNPKRRSRSVGAVQADHRMSPIQWRNVRRRSDEIKYWRESADPVPSHASKNLSPNVPQAYQETVEEGGEFGEQSADFNFGLPPDDIHGHERMGLEERLVTLELKLMDVEYSISKFQAGVTSISRSDSHDEERYRSIRDSHISSDLAQGQEESLATHHTSPNIPYQHSFESTPKARPVSVATTMKAGPLSQHMSHQKGSAASGNGSSLSGLAAEHYTTLVSLIRNERSARMRLEEQVSQLQKQVDRLLQPYQLHSQQPSISPSHSRSQHSHTYSQSSQQRRHGMVEPGNSGSPFYKQQRRRSSSYSTNETDTDDDVYYATPEITTVERGEYERALLERVSGVAEGAAF